MQTFLFLLTILLIASCREQTNNPDLQSIKTDTSKAFIIEIPTYKNGKNRGDTDYLFKVIREQSKQLKLPHLEKGYDSLEIRIWLGHSLAIKRNVVIIQRKKSTWAGQLATFTVGHDKDGQEFVDKRQIENVIPKSGWETLIKKLLSYQITTLPNEDDIKGYNGCGFDGLPYYFEISTRHQYRFFTYCNIEGNIQNFSQARNVDHIARLLEKELSFQFTR